MCIGLGNSIPIFEKNSPYAMNKFSIILSFFAFCLLFSCTKEVSNQEPEFEIKYEKFILDNGLEVILHEDHSDPIVAVATVLHVGSNREKTGRTGFAHFFEHMSFNDSENVPRGANRKVIPEWGGSRNGGTWSDGTVYYEVVPKDAFDKILWIDSDRLGYMINTVTEAALEREKQVVKNEKRQNYDNRPYGYTEEIKRKNLYPQGHPYSWTVIGSLPDLQSATLEDVKEFYEKYYGASNASLVIAGDINIEETKSKVQRWFGEIRKGPEVTPLEPMPVVLEETKSLYFEDNFAKLPELRIVFPAVEDYHPDSYALNALAQILSGSKKSPLYQVIVEEKKLAPEVNSYNNTLELTGEFTIRIRANAGVPLDSVKLGVDEALKRFEQNGFDDTELERIKAELEMALYEEFSTVLNKAFQLVIDNEYKGDPGYITQRANNTAAVTKEDVIRVYDKYLKGKNYLMTSFVPNGQIELAVSGSQKAEVWVEEVRSDVANEEVSQGEEAKYEKTPSKNDRSEPDFGELPLFKAPQVWKSQMNNGVAVLGIQNSELPLVTFDLTFDGGHFLDPIDKPGVANLTASLMMEGTSGRTPAQLEETIGLLGARIETSANSEELRISGTCLSRNLEATLSLVKEILTQPRWDQKEFDRLKQSLETEIKGRMANPTSVASKNFFQKIYSEKHIMGLPRLGSLASVEAMTIEDCQSYFKKLVPQKLTIHLVGNIDQESAMNALGIFEDLKGEDFSMPSYDVPDNINAGKIFFIDIPGSKQSVLFGGKLLMSGNDPNLIKVDYANEILGGGGSGRLFQVLRIDKGYTYGAYSFINEFKVPSPFIVYSSVRANATLKSMEIIRDMIQDYGSGFTEADVETTKTKILKTNTRAYESLGSKLDILRNVSKYNRPLNYPEIDQQKLLDMSLEDYKSIIANNLQEEELFYIIVGDKATQLQEIKKLGKPVVEIDLNGELIGE